MGRSSASCFKIMACGGRTESVDRDDMDASSENKGSDKRGWSFRKRSARHRVLSNTVVTEIPSSVNKESSEPLTIINSEAPVSSTISDKSYGIQWTEEIPLSSTSTTKDTTVLTEKTSAAQLTEEMPHFSTSTTKDSTVPTMVNKAAFEDDVKCGSDPDESVIIVIQAAVRGFMAQRELVRHKNAVKLQAAVRGHLVRNHAVGTLRCVQAIVKMQALVRSRRATERPSLGEKEVENSRTESRPTYVIEKLLSNRFARQLMESTPTTKQINIKCDPSRSDSAWKWLERWMSVSSSRATVETVEPHAPEQVQLQTVYESMDMKTDVVEAPVPSEGKEKSISSEKNTQDSHENSDFLHDEMSPLNSEAQIEEKPPLQIEQTNVQTVMPKEAAVPSDQNSDVISHDEEKPQAANTYIPDSKEKSEFLPDENSHLNSGVQIGVNSSIPEKHVESEIEVPKRSAKRLATDQADSEGRKSVFGSKKASNPAFIAAQSRFEELTSSKTNSLKSAGSFNHDNIVDSPEIAIQTRDVESTERVSKIGGSECGTELSVTSTLDSPDESEVINMKFENEAKDNNEGAGDAIDIEENSLLGTELTMSVLPEKHENGDNEKLKPSNSVDVDIPQAEQKLEENASNTEIELNPKSSPEASPRSHITVPESQGTPSSQLSTNNKKTKSDKKVSSQKRKSWSTSKKSPGRSSLDSGLRRSLENLPKDPSKPVKRRNNFGSPRPDQVDEEGRDSSSSNPLPSYMQATESAKAKALANSSPRSSPDVQDKEIYVKKRHSLPGALNGRHSSPRIQRSMSQAQPTTKGNDTNVTEKKWQR